MKDALLAIGFYFGTAFGGALTIAVLRTRELAALLRDRHPGTGKENR